MSLKLLQLRLQKYSCMNEISLKGGDYENRAVGWKRAQATKKGWRRHRFNYKAGIERFHRNNGVRGSMFRDLRSKVSIGSNESLVVDSKEILEELVGLSKMICSESCSDSKEEYLEFLDEASRAVLSVYESVREGKSVSFSEMEMFLLVAGYDRWVGLGETILESEALLDNFLRQAKMNSLDTLTNLLNKMEAIDDPVGGDFTSGLASDPISVPTVVDKPDVSKPMTPTSEIPLEVPPEEATRQLIEEVLEDNGVMTVLLRQDEGQNYWDAIFPEDLTVTITFAKVASEEGKEPMWAMLIMTPNEVFSTQVKEEALTDEGDQVKLPDALDSEYLQAIVGKYTNPDYKIECFALEDDKGGTGSVGDLGKPVEGTVKYKVKRSIPRKSWKRHKLVM